MSQNKKWKLKAKEHFIAGKILYENKLYRDSLARLYYSAYSIMVSMCGDPPSGRWAHKGILKCFFKALFEEDITLNKEDRKRLRDFYELRRLADYEIESIEKEEVEVYINLVERLFEVLKND
ncbi:HEPN domain-containing protein [Persephonella sp. KM09-Lau-8]|uniref:HEPN domain-containing protein n=1 Tax=Persephonella sp. KM09-Lau-8 TaxID=1158345 RepID=UPI000497282A|nr:HEPN domain-containing protein [Persephonella sp. KM09-Lau-8]